MKVSGQSLCSCVLSFVLTFQKKRKHRRETNKKKTIGVAASTGGRYPLSISDVSEDNLFENYSY
jgi:hypothetical protein